MIKTSPFNVMDYLDSPEMIAAYLSEAHELGDAAYIAHAIDIVAKLAESRPSIEPAPNPGGRT